MQNFISFKQFICDSIIDPLRRTLCPHVFENLSSDNPKLKSFVLKFINFKLQELKKNLNIIDYVLIGSMVTRRWTEKSDFDVNILIKDNNENLDELRNIAHKNSGTVIPTTQHPLNFHILTSRSKFEHANNVADAVFNLKENRFIRKALDRPFDVTEYLSAFRLAVSNIDLLVNDLKHDLIDYDQLKSMSNHNLKNLYFLIQREIQEIEKSVNGLVDYYEKIKQDRRNAFSKPITQKEIRAYGTKNRLPENVIYKLLERYNYLEFLHKVEEILGEDRKLSNSEIDRLSDYVLKK